MKKINKITNIALIFMLIGMFLCQNLAYSASDFCLRPAVGISSERLAKIMNLFHARHKNRIAELFIESIEEGWVKAHLTRDLLEIDPFEFPAIVAALAIIVRLEKGLDLDENKINSIFRKDFRKLIKPGESIIITKVKGQWYVRHYRMFLKIENNKVTWAEKYPRSGEEVRFDIKTWPEKPKLGKKLLREFSKAQESDNILGDPDRFFKFITSYIRRYGELIAKARDAAFNGTKKEVEKILIEAERAGRDIIALDDYARDLSRAIGHSMWVHYNGNWVNPAEAKNLLSYFEGNEPERAFDKIKRIWLPERIEALIALSGKYNGFMNRETTGLNRTMAEAEAYENIRNNFEKNMDAIKTSKSSAEIQTLTDKVVNDISRVSDDLLTKIQSKAGRDLSTKL